MRDGAAVQCTVILIRNSSALPGHMHIFPFSSASPESERARRARRRSVIDCLEAILREGNLNSRTTPHRASLDARLTTGYRVAA